MAKKSREPRLRYTQLRHPERITRDEPLQISLRLENRASTTLHVSDRIHGFKVSPDGKTLALLTGLPTLADNVHVNLTSLPTRPVDPGESVEFRYTVTFPLRLVEMSGARMAAVAREWMPAGPLAIELKVVYGDHPFYTPAEGGRGVREALEKWTNELAVEPIQLAVEAARGGHQPGAQGE